MTRLGRRLRHGWRTDSLTGSCPASLELTARDFKANKENRLYMVSSLAEPGTSWLKTEIVVSCVLEFSSFSIKMSSSERLRQTLVHSCESSFGLLASLVPDTLAYTMSPSPLRRCLRIDCLLSVHCLHGVCLAAPAMHTPSLPALLAPPCTALCTAASLSVPSLLRATALFLSSLSLRLSRIPLCSPSAPSPSSSLPPLPHFLPLRPTARCLPPRCRLSPLPLPLPPSPHALCPTATPLLVPAVISPPVPATSLSASNALPSTPADFVYPRRLHLLSPSPSAPSPPPSPLSSTLTSHALCPAATPLSAPAITSPSVPVTLLSALAAYVYLRHPCRPHPPPTALA